MCPRWFLRRILAIAICLFLRLVYARAFHCNGEFIANRAQIRKQTTRINHVMNFARELTYLFSFSLFQSYLIILHDENKEIQLDGNKCSESSKISIFQHRDYSAWWHCHAFWWCIRAHVCWDSMCSDVRGMQRPETRALRANAVSCHPEFFCFPDCNFIPSLRKNVVPCM